MTTQADDRVKDDEADGQHAEKEHDKAGDHERASQTEKHNDPSSIYDGVGEYLD